MRHGGHIHFPKRVLRCKFNIVFVGIHKIFLQYFSEPKAWDTFGRVKGDCPVCFGGIALRVGVDGKVKVAVIRFRLSRTLDHFCFLVGARAGMRRTHNRLNAVCFQVLWHGACYLPHMIFLASRTVAVRVPWLRGRTEEYFEGLQMRVRPRSAECLRGNGCRSLRAVSGRTGRKSGQQKQSQQGGNSNTMSAIFHSEYT